MSDRQEEIENIVQKLLKDQTEQFIHETGASQPEAEMAAMTTMLQDLKTVMGARLPELIQAVTPDIEQAIAVLEQSRLEAQIRQANKDQQPE